MVAVWVTNQNRKISPKRKFSVGRPAKNFGQALQILEKNKHFATDMPRGRPRKNFGLKSFGLTFRSLTKFLVVFFFLSWRVSGEALQKMSFKNKQGFKKEFCMEESSGRLLQQGLFEEEGLPCDRKSLHYSNYHCGQNHYSQLSYCPELISITVTVTVTALIFPGINHKTVMW